MQQAGDPQAITAATVVPDSSHVSIQETEKSDLVNFFVVGAVINLVLVGVYLLWAIRQWRMKKR